MASCTKMSIIMNDFKQWCDLIYVQDAINGTHFLILKPSMPFPKENYYFKYGGYSIIVAHVVVDCKKMFTDICIGFAKKCQ